MDNGKKSNRLQKQSSSIIHFYPNECFVCKSRENLRQCSRCQMISYCSDTHQKEHLGFHKDICKTISHLIKKKKISHLYEKCHGFDNWKWKQERESAWVKIKTKLFRHLLPCEYQMLLYPRVCFMCRDARQQYLKNCPSCPSVSYCPDHKDLTPHAVTCREMLLCHDTEIKLQNIEESEAQDIADAVLNQIFLSSTGQKPPKTMNELMKQYSIPMETDDALRAYASDFLTLPLTVFNALQKTNLSPSPKLVVHVAKFAEDRKNIRYFEIILHLIPNLKFLKVVITDAVENEEEMLNLCDRCVSAHKQLEIETSDLIYKKYMREINYEVPNVLLSCNLEVDEEDTEWRIEMLNSLLNRGSFPCLVVLTTDIETKSKIIKQCVTSTLPKAIIYYDGCNEFASEWLHRRWQFEGIYIDNRFMIVFKILCENTKNARSEVPHYRSEKRPISFEKNTQKTSNVDKDDTQNASKLSKTQIEKPSETARDKIVKINSIPESVQLKSNSDKIKIEKSSQTIDERSENTSLFDDDLFLDLDESATRIFKINACQVCYSIHKCIPCTRCKMISYCKEEHRKRDWPKHKELCKVILGLLKESGTSTLFDKSTANDMESWVRIKTDLVRKAQSKLGRQLVKYEREIFLFPRTCFVCHESDLSIITTCDCGVSLCRQHWKNPKHNSMCSDFKLGLKLDEALLLFRLNNRSKKEEDKIINISFTSIPHQQKVKKLPCSMKAFINSYIKLPKECTNIIEKYRLEIISDLLSRSLTTLFAIEKLALTTETFLSIHVIGADNEEFRFFEYWEFLLHWLPDLKRMNFNFLGPEIKKGYGRVNSLCSTCWSIGKKSSFFFVRQRYEEYFKEELYVKPDIIIGFNLNLHESEYGIAHRSWKETMLVLTKLDIPFVLTAESEERAMKDHKTLGDLLGKSVPYSYCEENPFASLVLKRDFETEELKQANKYVLIYKELGEELTKPDQLEESSVVKTPGAVNVSKMENNLSIDNLRDKSQIEKIGEVEKEFSDVKQRRDEKTGENFENTGKTRIVQAEELQKSTELERKPNILSEREEGKKYKDAEKKESERKTVPFSFEEKQTETPENAEEKASMICKAKLQETQPKEVPNSVEFQMKLKNAISVDKITDDEESKILKENLLLRKENDILRTANEKLEFENTRLRAENHLIGDIRNQVQESIKSAMTENK